MSALTPGAGGGMEGGGMEAAAIDGPIIPVTENWKVGDGGCCRLCGIALTEDDMQESLKRKQRICEGCVDEGNEKLTKVQTALAQTLIFNFVEKYPPLLEGLVNCQGNTRVDAMKMKDVMMKCIAQVKIDAPQMLEQIRAVPAKIFMKAACDYPAVMVAEASKSSIIMDLRCKALAQLRIEADGDDECDKSPEWLLVSAIVRVVTQDKSLPDFTEEFGDSLADFVSTYLPNDGWVTTPESQDLFVRFLRHVLMRTRNVWAADGELATIYAKREEGLPDFDGDFNFDYEEQRIDVNDHNFEQQFLRNKLLAVKCGLLPKTVDVFEFLCIGDDEFASFLEFKIDGDKEWTTVTIPEHLRSKFKFPGLHGDSDSGGLYGPAHYTVDEEGNIEPKIVRVGVGAKKKTSKKYQWPTHAEKLKMDEASAAATRKSKSKAASMKKEGGAAAAAAYGSAMKDQEGVALKIAQLEQEKKQGIKLAKAKFSAFVTEEEYRASGKKKSDSTLSDAEQLELEKAVAKIYSKDGKKLDQEPRRRGGGKKKK